jgi:hypothetical protein
MINPMYVPLDCSRFTELPVGRRMNLAIMRLTVTGERLLIGIELLRPPKFLERKRDFQESTGAQGELGKRQLAYPCFRGRY